MTVLSIDEIVLKQKAQLFDNLPVQNKSIDIQSMKKFDQGWGSIMYSKNIPACDKPRKLIITDAHDWAQIFVHGERIGTLDRLSGEKEVIIPALDNESTLDILVEALGRVNFGEAIHDRKVLTYKHEFQN